ncbi:12082_t:CDS:2, partial [Entrophospora sp. SA101]
LFQKNAEKRKQDTLDTTLIEANKRRPLQEIDENRTMLIVMLIKMEIKSILLQDKLAASGIMDLTSKSMLSNKVPEKTYRTFISSLDTFDKLIPDEEHVFLVYFFGQLASLFPGPYEPTAKHQFLGTTTFE